jgi:F-type H+-transporting ATPase subunit gamma
MAKNLQDIRKRIDSVENTKQITRAMKMVATAKLRQAEERVEASRPYANQLRRVIASLLDRVDDEVHPLLEQRERRDKALIFVVSTNRGLCGSFNASLFREIRDFTQTLEVADEDVDVATMGDKADIHFRRQEETDIVEQYDEIIGDVSYERARGVAQDGIDWFLSGEYDAVYVAYNEHISAIQYEQRIEPMLPLSVEDLLEMVGIDPDEPEKIAELAGGEGRAVSEYIFEPDEEGLLSYMLPRHLEVQILQALLESGAAEQAARRQAMDNATENAEEMIEDLTLEFNRARQAAITTEIMEIVSGAEAMKE